MTSGRNKFLMFLGLTIITMIASIMVVLSLKDDGYKESGTYHHDLDHPDYAFTLKINKMIIIFILFLLFN